MHRCGTVRADRGCDASAITCCWKYLDTIIGANLCGVFRNTPVSRGSHISQSTTLLFSPPKLDLLKCHFPFPSEVSHPEAIYEECSYTAPLKRSSPEPPPPLPVTRPSVGSHGSVPASPDLDYEVFPAETAAQRPVRLETSERNVPVAAATPAPPIETHPEYEPFPVEAVPPFVGPAGPASASTASVTPAGPGNRRSPTLQYAVPLVGGKTPDGRQSNSSFAERPTDGGPEAPPVAGGEEEAEYALPYRASVAEPARRSIPDVAMVAMGADTAEPVAADED